MLLSIDNLDGSAKQQFETALREVTMCIRRLTGYGRMKEGMRKGDVCINQAQYTHNTEKPKCKEKS
jgi:hypothetical protein